LTNSPVGVETAVEEIPEVLVDASLQPNHPGVAQLAEELDAAELDEELAVWVAVELADGFVVELAVERAVELAVCALLVAGVSAGVGVVTIGSGAALGDVIVVVRVSVVGSLHPNQPGVLHEEVVIVLVIVVVGVCDVVVVVDSS
jgi:hypothetical protein